MRSVHQFMRHTLIAAEKKCLLRWLVLGALVAQVRGAELKTDTAAAFDGYIRATEVQHADDLRAGHFLAIDRLPEILRREQYAKLQQGQIYIEQLHTKADGRSIRIPGGLVHHWVGVVFIPGATLPQVITVLQDYDNHSNIYKPDVRRSRLLEHNGNEFKTYLQLYRKSIVTVVINANFDVHYMMDGPKRALSQAYSTRIAEVENPDRPNEHELRAGNDHGYLWRLDNYSRVEEKDGGTYFQVESVGLSRTIPAIFAWLINPLVRSVPRAVLSDLLNATRKEVTAVKVRRSGLRLPQCSDPHQLLPPSNVESIRIQRTKWDSVAPRLLGKGQSQFWQLNAHTRRSDFGDFRRLRNREPLFTPGFESTLQHPYVPNAYPLQRYGCASAHRITARRRIENNLHVIRNVEIGRLSQRSGIYSESSRNSLRVFALWFEVQEVKHCNLPTRFQFAGEQWRSDAAKS
jgi:hypothetical protein